MRFKGVAGASKSQVGVDTVVFGLLGETPKARTFSEIMVAQCKSFGMKPVCQVPAYCQKDARSLYVPRVFPLYALVPRVQGSSGVVDNMLFAWRGHTKRLTARARPSPDHAVWLE